jgi:hypothetical protein
MNPTQSDPLHLAEAAERLGAHLAKSTQFGLERLEQGITLAWHLLHHNQSPLDFLRTWQFVKGRLSMRADAMLAEFRGKFKGECVWLSDLTDAKAARAVFSYRENRQEASFTWQDAEREGLTARGKWKENPAEMLRARLVSKVLRMICPEIVAGVYLSDEVDPTAEADPAPRPATPLLPEAATRPQDPPPGPRAPDAAPQTSPVRYITPSRLEPPEDAKALADAGLAPTAAPACSTSPVAPTDAPRSPQEEFALFVAPFAAQARAFARAKGWIDGNQGLAEIPVAKMKATLARAIDFMKAAKAHIPAAL